MAISLSSTDRDSYLYLYEGPHHRGELVEEDDNDGTEVRNKDAKITRKLAKGVYTVGATTESSNSSGFYTLEINNKAITSLVRASLTPDPTTAYISRNRVWHAFRVVAGEPVKIIANPTGYSRRIEIHTSRPNRSYCAAEQNDTKYRTNGQSIYFVGCAAGTAVVEFRSQATNKLLKTYRITIR